MSDLSIDQADIDGLARALDGLDLTPKQNALLSAIVAMAAKVVDTELPSTTGSFCDQFARAFTPGQCDLLIKPSSMIGRVNPSDLIGRD